MKLLLESFDPSIPNWLRKFLAEKYTVAAAEKNYIALDKLKFTRIDLPTSSKGIKRTGKFGTTVFLLCDKSVYFPGLNDKQHYFSGGSFKSTSIENILRDTIDIGYVNTNDEAVNIGPLKGKRREAKFNYLSTAARRKDAQYKLHDTEYIPSHYDDSGNYVYGKTVVKDTYTWQTKPNFDKSGYPLDPDKYKRMLDDVNLSTYSTRLDSYYKKLQDLRSDIVNDLNNLDVRKYSNSDDLFRALDEFKNAVYYYNSLNRGIENIINNDEYENKDLGIRAAFDWDGLDLRKYIEKSRQYLDRSRNKS